MQIWMSAEVDKSVSEDLRRARLTVEREWNAFLDGRTYDTDLVEWAVIIILREQIPPGWGEIRKYHRMRKEVEFRVIVDFDAFRTASPEKQVSLVAAAVLGTFDKAAELGVSGSGIVAFKDDLTRFARDRKWLAGP